VGKFGSKHSFDPNLPTIPERKEAQLMTFRNEFE